MADKEQLRRQVARLKKRVEELEASHATLLNRLAELDQNGDTYRVANGVLCRVSAGVPPVLRDV